MVEKRKKEDVVVTNVVVDRRLWNEFAGEATKIYGSRGWKRKAIEEAIRLWLETKVKRKHS